MCPSRRRVHTPKCIATNQPAFASQIRVQHMIPAQSIIDSATTEVAAPQETPPWDLTFFMMPALRLEKVMCRRDLSWMNLMSIFRRSRPGLSSSSSSSSAAALTRGRLMPRFSPPCAPLPLPVAIASSWTDGDWAGSARSAMSASKKM